MVCFLQCQIGFTDDDVVILNAKDEDFELMTKRMEIRQANAKKNKEKKTKIKTEMPEESDVKKSETSNDKQAQKRTSTVVTGCSSEIKKKLKKDYSVAKDPQVSDVYKSLFTSHKSEQEQNRAHWVTYNPFYN